MSEDRKPVDYAREQLPVMRIPTKFWLTQPIEDLMEVVRYQTGKVKQMCLEEKVPIPWEMRL